MSATRRNRKVCGLQEDSAQSISNSAAKEDASSSRLPAIARSKNRNVGGLQEDSVPNISHSAAVEDDSSSRLEAIPINDHNSNMTSRNRKSFDLQEGKFQKNRQKEENYSLTDEKEYSLKRNYFEKISKSSTKQPGRSFRLQKLPDNHKETDYNTNLTKSNSSKDNLGEASNENSSRLENMQKNDNSISCDHAEDDCQKDHTSGALPESTDKKRTNNRLSREMRSFRRFLPPDILQMPVETQSPEDSSTHRSQNHCGLLENSVLLATSDSSLSEVDRSEFNEDEAKSRKNGLLEDNYENNSESTIDESFCREPKIDSKPKNRLSRENRSFRRFFHKDMFQHSDSSINKKNCDFQENNTQKFAEHPSAQDSFSGQHQKTTIDNEKLKYSAMTKNKNSDQILEQIASLYLNQDLSDVTFSINGDLVYAHKVILGLRSEYFRILLYDQKTSNPVQLGTVSIDVFKNILKYLYTDSITVEKKTLDISLKTLDLAQEYKMADATLIICQELINIVDLQNVCQIMERAMVHNLQNVTQYCLEFICKNAEEFLNTEIITNASENLLAMVFQQEQFQAPKIDVSNAVIAWCKTHGWKSQKLNQYAKIEAIAYRNRHAMVQTEPDVLQPKSATGTLSNAFASTDTLICTTDGQLLKAATSNPLSLGHILDPTNSSFVSFSLKKGFSIQLINPGIYNNIEMLLYTIPEKFNSYRYYVEASFDGKTWEKIIDYTNYECRGRQTLFFPTKLLKYINVVGTHSSSTNTFDVKYFQLFCRRKIPELTNALIHPDSTWNLNYNCLLLKSAIKCDDNAIVEKSNTPDGHNSIIVQLAQPYMINTIEITPAVTLTSYQVAVSVDKTNWTAIRQLNDLWETVKFPLQPVLYIKITEMANRHGLCAVYRIKCYSI